MTDLEMSQSAASADPPLTLAEAEALLYREALLLDTGAWDAWLSLYAEDCVFWMPAWRDETTPTADPDTELSLIYYRGRRNLEDRVWRARSNTSVASRPRARVVHLVTNVLIDRAGPHAAIVSSAFAVHRHDVRGDRTHAFFGRYTHGLRRGPDGWLIASKTILLLNDVIPTVVDFYSI